MKEAGHLDRVVPAIRVFLIDDHEVVRRGVAEVLEDDPGITIVGEAGTAAEALARVPAVRPDVAVIDLRLPDGNGVDVCRELRARLPELRCLLLTSFSDKHARGAAAAAGASGYLLKQVRGSVLIAAVHAVAAGGSLETRDAAADGLEGTTEGVRAADQRVDRLASLTVQERNVLQLIAEGLTNRQIGTRMGLAEKTVKNYTSHLLAKLGLERRTQAAILATELRDLDRPAG